MTNANKIMCNKVIAAVRTSEELLCAASSDVKIVFDLSPNILTIEENVAFCIMQEKTFHSS